MRIGGCKTPSMFRRYNVVDERDLSEAAERLSGFLTDASRAEPTIVPLTNCSPEPRRGGRSPRNADRTRTFSPIQRLRRPSRPP